MGFTEFWAAHVLLMYMADARLDCTCVVVRVSRSESMRLKSKSPSCAHMPDVKLSMTPTSCKNKKTKSNGAVSQSPAISCTDTKKRDSIASASSLASLLEVPQRSARWPSFRTKPVVPLDESSSFVDNLQVCLESQGFERVMGILIFVHLFVIIMETDARSESSEGTGLGFYLVISTVFIFSYVLECVSRLILFGQEFWLSGWNVLDAALVVLDVVAIVVGFAGNSDSSAMRGFRLLRLFRLCRALIAFPELLSLVTGFCHCFRMLLWALFLVFITLTAWSIAAVEFIKPLMQDVEYGSCVWCPDAFRSVMASNLTFLQIVLGDGWSTLARPIIDRHAWTSFVFASVTVIVVWGITTLVVVSVFNLTQGARQADDQRAAAAAAKSREEGWQLLSKMCQDFDSHNDGFSLDTEQLRSSFLSQTQVGECFSVIGVREEDITELLLTTAGDSTGGLTVSELHGHLHKMHTLEVKTHLYCVARYVMRVQEQQASQERLLRQMSQEVHELAKSNSAWAQTVATIADATARPRNPIPDHDAAPPVSWHMPPVANERCIQLDPASSPPPVPSAGVSAGIGDSNGSKAPPNVPQRPLDDIFPSVENFSRLLDALPEEARVTRFAAQQALLAACASQEAPFDCKTTQPRTGSSAVSDNRRAHSAGAAACRGGSCESLVEPLHTAVVAANHQYRPRSRPHKGSSAGHGRFFDVVVEDKFCGTPNLVHHLISDRLTTGSGTHPAEWSCESDWSISGHSKRPEASAVAKASR